MADLTSQVAILDANGFRPTLESLVAGDSSSATGYFQFPPGIDLSGAVGSWSVLNNVGAVLSQGTLSSLSVTTDSFKTLATLVAVVSVPSTTPPSSEGNSYQLRWSLSSLGNTYFSFSALKVLGLTSSPVGPANTVELEGDKFTLATILEKAYTVTCSVYGPGNAKLVDDTAFPVATAIDVAGGKLYKVEVDPSNVSPTGVNPFVATLDPYIVSWKAVDSNTFVSNRLSSKLFIVNSSILGAVEDVSMQVMKARTTQFGFPDVLFDPVTILSWLRRGRDLFNSASGHLTEFTMTNATGGVREYWLRYSEVAMLLSQSLAEGEKAFNFSGSSIQLDVDKSQVYQQMASELQQRLDNDIKPFKQNLIKKGAVAGDGNITGAAMSSGAVSRLGIGIHPASQFGRPWRGNWPANQW